MKMPAGRGGFDVVSMWIRVVANLHSPVCWNEPVLGSGRFGCSAAV